MLSATSLLISANVTNLAYFDSNYSIQIGSTSSISSYPTIINNNLSIIDFSLCEKKLKSHYNIPTNKSLIYSKMDLNSNSSFGLSKQINFRIYSPLKNKKELNISVCNGIPYIISIPNNISFLNQTLIEEFQKFGINITDINDSFFTDRCLDYDKVIHNITGNKNYYTLPLRKEHLFQSGKLSCQSNGLNCVPIVSTMKNYTNCSCIIDSNNNVAQLSFLKTIVSLLPELNYNIILCYNLIKDYFNNLGFILSLSICSFGYILCIFFFIFRKKIVENNWEIIVRYDSYTIKTDMINLLDFKEKIDYPESNINGYKPQFSESPKIPISQNKENSHSSNVIRKQTNSKYFINRELIDLSIPVEEIARKLSQTNSALRLKNLLKNLSLRDLDELSSKALKKYDDRSFLQYLRDYLMVDNLFLKTFFGHSIRRPKFIQILILCQVIVINFLVNAFLFQDDDIATLEKYNTLQNIIDNPAKFILVSFISITISFFSNFFLLLIIKIPKIILADLNESLRTRDLTKIMNQYDTFLSSMKIRIASYIIATIILNLLSMYYLTIFFSIYKDWALIILLRGVFSILADLLIIDTFIPILTSIIRIFSLKFKFFGIFMKIKAIFTFIKLLNS